MAVPDKDVVARSEALKVDDLVEYGVNLPRRPTLVRGDADVDLSGSRGVNKWASVTRAMCSRTGSSS
jgi:hypothetical protein